MTLWVVYPGSIEWVHLDAPYDYEPEEFTITSWSYVAEGEEPTVAVDYSGNPIYGYQQKFRVVSLSPSITEILASSCRSHRPSRRSWHRSRRRTSSSASTPTPTIPSL